NALLIFGVAGQIPCEEVFLVKKSPDQKWNYCCDCNKSPVRAECQRRASEVQRSARIHRMTNDCVWPGGDNSLIFGYCDRCGRKRVFAIHREDEIKPHRDEQVSRENDGIRHFGPSESMIESRHD